MHAGHAALHEAVARYLNGVPGWIHSPEVSFAVFRERGVIDILAFHPPTGSLLVIELKTELVSLEDLLSTMDVRLRHAQRMGRVRRECDQSPTRGRPRGGAALRVFRRWTQDARLADPAQWPHPGALVLG
jgi:hypothetical protein